jgi:hypothetical protein
MKILKTVATICFLGIAAFIAINWTLYEDNINPLVFDRGPEMVARLEDFSETMTEEDVMRLVPKIPLWCKNETDSPQLGNRVCFSNIRAYAGIRALRVAFFFSNKHLAHITIHIPWWLHAQMGQQLIQKYGNPAGAQDTPVNGVRLIGWRLENGTLLYNRDKDSNPLMWNNIFWISPLQSRKNGGVFINTFN